MGRKRREGSGGKEGGKGERKGGRGGREEGREGRGGGREGRGGKGGNEVALCVLPHEIYVLGPRRTALSY